MTDDMTKRRDKLAYAYATGNNTVSFADTSDAAAFSEGFDACYKEMQVRYNALEKIHSNLIEAKLEDEEQVDSLKAQLDELKQELANVDRAVLIAKRRVHGDQADKMEASQEAAHYNWLDDQNEALKAQLKAKDAQLEIALNALETIKQKTLEQIQKMRGVCNLSQTKGPIAS